ncbi:hypothetical protein [Pontibacillus salipaludis]|uniref:Ribosomal protein L7/L12 C-terminal domain-containing protein n=1 Tax=Pontibacillus salipaludis TaxID=1697394 RepID=A0ABQ1Q7P5_9BACI|nr:hypothetical protein [Pontibacillus salipaludis]GGD15752.1 hypothetical protein GCM10011389_24340 [Pontibacillus salipaludis]
MNIVTVIVLLFIIFGIVVMGNLKKVDKEYKQVKNKVDRIKRDVDVSEPEVNEELRTLIQKGEEVKAVKRARQALGLSLLEGKQYVDVLNRETE